MSLYAVELFSSGGAVRLPWVEELLVSYLSPGTASSLKAPALPMGVERACSARGS